MPLSARNGEREGPGAKRREGEVFIVGMIASVFATHLTRSLTLAPSPPNGRRVLGTYPRQYANPIALPVPASER